MDAFELFAAYHLGVTADGEYRFQNLHELAGRLGIGAAELESRLEREGIDAASVMAKGFDLVGAQVEVSIAPSPVERLALARRHYDAFRAAVPRERDWDRELAEDAAENAKTFGPAKASTDA